jgi:hypothetical protein
MGCKATAESDVIYRLVAGEVVSAGTDHMQPASQARHMSMQQHVQSDVSDLNDDRVPAQPKFAAWSEKPCYSWTLV